MESLVYEWENMGLMKEMLKHKLMFFETKDLVETTLALDNYKKACDRGRGAIFMSIARGKVWKHAHTETHTRVRAHRHT